MTGQTGYEAKEPLKRVCHTVMCTGRKAYKLKHNLEQ